MRILFSGQNPSQGLKNIDSTSLRSVARELGHNPVEEFSDEPDLVLCVDWNALTTTALRRAKQLGIPRVLIKNEPSVVLPGHSNPKIDARFNKALEVGRPNAIPLLHWPQSWNLTYFNRSGRVSRAVAINANKFSFVSGELYSLRAKAYSQFDQLDVYGTGWDRPIFQNFLKLAKELQIALAGSRGQLTFACAAHFNTRPRNQLGPAKDKLETLSGFKASVVIENSLEFMSEKLLDSIMAGTIPVYVGPNVSVFGIPESLVYVAEPNCLSVGEAMKVALEADHEKWKKLAWDWLSKEQTRKTWEARSAMERIISAAVSGVESS